MGMTQTIPCLRPAGILRIEERTGTWRSAQDRSREGVIGGDHKIAPPLDGRVLVLPVGGQSCADRGEIAAR